MGEPGCGRGDAIESDYCKGGARAADISGLRQGESALNARVRAKTLEELMRRFTRRLVGRAAHRFGECRGRLPGNRGM